MADEFLYVYGIVSKDHPVFPGASAALETSGIDGAPLSAVAEGSLVAVVSPLGDPTVDPLRRHVRAHVSVQHELIQDGGVLPMGFGMVAQGEAGVRAVLRHNHDALAAELQRFLTTIEASVSVLWAREAMAAELERRGIEIDEIRDQMSEAPRDRAEVMAAEAGRAIRDIVVRWQEADGASILKTLAGLAVNAVRFDSTQSRCILAASFLIKRTREADFRQLIHDVDREHEGKYEMKYVAPLPPYSFVSVKVDRGLEG